jgi:hypothetical protein
MLSIPVVPKKPMRPGGRAHRSRAEANYEPGKGKKLGSIEVRDSDDGEPDVDIPGDIGLASTGCGDEEEDPGKTYDDTDEE